jgi:hypothetical protein
VIAAQSYRYNSRFEQWRETCLNLLDTVIDVLRWNVEIAVVHDPQRPERTPESVRTAVRPDLRCSLTNAARAKARTRTVIDTRIKRNADDGNVRPRQIASDRNAHERVDARVPDALLPLGWKQAVMGSRHL